MIIIKFLKPNDLAYLDYERSYDRNTVIVLLTTVLQKTQRATWDAKPTKR